MRRSVEARIRDLEKRLEKLKKEEQEQTEKRAICDNNRLAKIGVLNANSCASQIALVARYAVDNEGVRYGKNDRIRIKCCSELTEKQKAYARDLAQKIIDFVEETYAQKAWLDDAET